MNMRGTSSVKSGFGAKDAFHYLDHLKGGACRKKLPTMICAQRFGTYKTSQSDMGYVMPTGWLTYHAARVFGNSFLLHFKSGMVDFAHSTKTRSSPSSRRAQ